ncbi:MAG TPA: tetratricopeptide repeat protein [Terriglobales bacterium]|nr:tetratricopeptide repeat protein [Terriglobales bacterium]
MKTTRYLLAVVLAVCVIGCAAAEAQKQKGKGSENDPQYQYEKGVVALNYGFPDEAIRYGNLALSLDPNHYGGHMLLGNAYYKKGDVARALPEFEKAAALKPNLPEAHFNYGLALFDTGEMDKAEAEFAKSEALKEDPVTSYYLGRVRFNQHKFEQALADVQKSIAENPKSPGAYNLKGVILNQLNRFAEAAGSFQAGLVLAPDDIGLQVNLGIAYMNSNEPAKAKPILEAALPKISDPVLKARLEEYLKSIKAP